MTETTDIDDRTRALATLLEWYQAMGVDSAQGDEPINWLARGDRPPAADYAMPTRASEPASPQSAAAPARQAPFETKQPSPERPQARPAPSAERPPAPRRAMDAPASAPARPFTSPAAEPAELKARALADEAKSLADLEARLKAFDGCGLKATAKNLCFYRGAERSRLMIIGEAPGREEDFEGRPFVGRAGQLLDKMLAAIAMSDKDVHITNIVYWRPPGNRTPTPQEAQICRPFLDRQIELVAPDAILLLGGAAAKHMLDVADGIMRIRGKWREITIKGRPIKAMATLHPAYLLRTPAAKRQAWRDLLTLKQQLTD